MSQLFSKNAIKSAISRMGKDDIESSVQIVQELHVDYIKGNMKDETRYEQSFNELFFHKLLGYEAKENWHPKASTPVGSKIADVGLGFFEDGLYKQESVRVVVELKGSGTMLDKKQASYGGQSPVDQGFGYKTSFKDCPWLIVSNFFEIRLYRDNKQDFERRIIDELLDAKDDYYQLRKLIALLHKDNFIAHTGTSKTQQLLSDVRLQQEKITKDFYKHYKQLRINLIKDIQARNSRTLSVATIVEKAQKIIDRIIFIHFCEDRGLLPEGKLQTNIMRAYEADFTPWEVLKKYFQGVDGGSEKLGIPDGYNGGLFHEDKMLNSLTVGDDICQQFVDLGHYDFDDELSVNILGHIFEQSISDLEEIKSSLLEEAGATQKAKEAKSSKRKKDGIFYTPEYIVDYIVQNSLMSYLEEKEKACLDQIGKKGGYKTELEAYQAYQHILQNVKVLDPACGSGAFLVKVFDYLFAENKRVGDIVGGLFTTDEMYKGILRNNIYGVDLNPESVEITKLSLWLKSAQKGKKLNNLDDNIKCGNSLIDDPAVAGERAFDWGKNFSDIITKEYSEPMMLTFVTKYSRIPQDEYSKKRYDAVMETGKDPVLLQPEGVQLIRDAIKEQVEKLGGILLNMVILPDHIHINLVPMNNDIPDIVNKLKGYTSYMYNRALQGTASGQGHQNTLRARGYSVTQLSDEKHLHNALDYVDHNHQKHSETWGENLLASFSHPSDSRGQKVIPYESFYYSLGGFDVIVGNPPYVLSRDDIFEKQKLYLNSTYKLIYEKPNLYMIFMEKSFLLLKNKGILGFIVPNSRLGMDSGKLLRKFLLENVSFGQMINLQGESFPGVSVETMIYTFQKTKGGDVQYITINDGNIPEITRFDSIRQSDWLNNRNQIIDLASSSIDVKIIEKLNGHLLLESVYDVKVGLQAYEKGKGNPKQTADDVKNHVFDYDYQFDQSTHKYLGGGDVGRYAYSWSGQWLRHGEWLSQPKEIRQFSEKRILIREITSKFPKILNAVYLDELFLNNKSIINILQKDEKYDLRYLLCILNSSLLGFYHVRRAAKGNRTLFPKVVINDVKNYPIKKNLLSDQQPFIAKADLMLSLNKELHEKVDFVLRFFQSKFGIEKLSTKLQKFREHDFGVFLKELHKSRSSLKSNSSLTLKHQVVEDTSRSADNLGLQPQAKSKKLSMNEEAELMEFFDAKKKEIVELKNRIDGVDREIDEMVYSLYGLTEEEKMVVEGRN